MGSPIRGAAKTHPPHGPLATLLATKTRVQPRVRRPGSSWPVPAPGSIAPAHPHWMRHHSGCSLILATGLPSHPLVYPHCPAPADPVDVRHLIWTCPRTRTDREHHVLLAGVRLARKPTGPGGPPTPALEVSWTWSMAPASRLPLIPLP